MYSAFLTFPYHPLNWNGEGGGTPDLTPPSYSNFNTLAIFQLCLTPSASRHLSCGLHGYHKLQIFKDIGAQV